MSANGQVNGWLPQVYIQEDVLVCDTGDWKLVFYDGFNGNQLSNQWLPYLTYKGMPGGDNDNWSGAMGDRPTDSYLYKKDNVYVSNGKAHLVIKKENYTWSCDTCSQSKTKNYTASIIETPFYLNGAHNYYNSGRFKARLKMPDFKGVLSSFWLWHGNEVNEIDILEFYGEDDNNTYPRFTYNTHAWKPPYATPYNLPDDAPLVSNARRSYPNQNFWNDYTHTRFDPTDWHTYGCQWDSTKLIFFVDDYAVDTVWKYFKQTLYLQPPQHLNQPPNNPVYYLITEHPACKPAISDTWQITFGFPYSKVSDSHLRLTTGINLDAYGGFSGFPDNTTLGEMLVDYVKIWQRHPSADGHTNLCPSPVATPAVSGPNLLCSNGTYTATPAKSGGYWTAVNGTVLNSGVNGNTAFANIKKSGFDLFGKAIYHYPSCYIDAHPEVESTKSFLCFDSHTPVFAIIKTENGYNNFHLFAPKSELTHELNPDFNWDISFLAGKNNTDTLHFLEQGRFISTPYFPENDNYFLKWTLTTTYRDGTSIIQEGELSEETSLGRQDTDTNVYYLKAEVTNSEEYENKVKHRAAQTSLPVNADTQRINQLIEQARTKELASYIVQKSDKEPSHPMLFQGRKRQTGDTKVYPSPAQNVLYIEPGKRFSTKSLIAIDIFDLSGRLVKTKEKVCNSNDRLNISLKGLQAGIYLVKLSQSDREELFKIIKKNN